MKSPRTGARAKSTAASAPATTLIRLDHMDVSLDGCRVLKNISWQLETGQNWAFLGPNGSGKSTLLKLIRGDLWPDYEGVERRQYFFDGQAQSSPIGVREKIAFVSPEQQERYWQSDWNLSGLETICTGLLQTDSLYGRADPTRKEQAHRIAHALGIEPLCRRGIREMSAGELRKILLARALAGRPRLLVLDEFCDGLDVRSRREILALLDQVAASGAQLLYSTHRANELVTSTTHVAMLDGGTITSAGRRKKVLAQNAFSETRQPGHAGSEFPPVAPFNEPFLNTGTPSASENRKRQEAGEKIFLRIENADVFLGRKKVIANLNWQMNVGENWLVVGRNGAGKSTLLKLISGELQAAWGGRVARFGRDDSMTVQAFRRNFGWVSADFQSTYREELTGEQVIASGYFASVGLLDQLDAKRAARVKELILRLELESLARKKFLAMSYGERRKILLARAVVHEPRVVILDEPFDGLDVATRAEFSIALESLTRDGTSVILVTHHLEDVPRGISHVLALENGRVLFQGRLADTDAQRALKKLLGVR